MHYYAETTILLSPESKEIAADFMLLHVKEKREKDFCVLEPVSNFVEEKCNGKKPTGAIE